MGFRLEVPTRPKAPEVKEYDVIVVGAGPAGLSAALYLARFMLKTVVVAKTIGGALTEAGIIDDYIGIPNIDGPKLGELFRSHVEKYGVPIITDEVIDIKREGIWFKVMTKGGFVLKSLAVIIATGSVRRRLNVPGEDRFRGKGVTYCAPCDAPLFKGKIIAIVGGGDAAASAAILTARYASKVYIIHRRDKLRAQPYWVKLISENPRIEVLYNKVVTEIGGDEFVKYVMLKDVKTGSLSTLNVNGVIIEIGSEPPREFFKRIGLKTTEEGYVLIGPKQETNIEGIFAAGDCTAGPCKYKFDQVVTAVAEGALAAYATYNYVLKIRRQ
ncbi:MAG: thioredoxin reductase [Desulfurococcales archaeon ex4484_42]|nr:MAG: thioredoxin reductase [Desulfurococcales archaeon ex4484_42]